MDIASLISYPMLPEFEKVIPKPLKKRYRDLFEGHDDRSAISNLENISANKISTYAFASPSHIPGNNESLGRQLHRPGNLYRKSVIKRSITKRISIEISPSLISNVSALNKMQDLQDESYRIDYADHADEKSKTPRFMYLSKNYLVNSPVKFTGKLKVKWREKYENLNGYEGVAERNGADLEAKNVAGCRTTAAAAAAKYSKAKKDSKVANADPNTTTLPADSQSQTDTRLETTADPPVVRKLERARKGLIYQKFMASTYSWNRKEKSTKNAESTQPKKRGRPRTVPENVKCTTSSEEDSLKPSSIALMRLEGKKNDSVGDNKKSKTSSYDKKKTDTSECIHCGLTVLGARKNCDKSTRKITYSERICRCYVADDIQFILDDIKVPAKRKRAK